MTNKHDVIADLETLTTIPEKSLHKILKKLCACICENVLEDILTNQGNISEIDLGIGTLYIKHDNIHDLKYHFKPSDTLNSGIIGTVEQNKNMLADILTEALGNKFTDLYKDLC